MQRRQGVLRHPALRVLAQGAEECGEVEGERRRGGVRLPCQHVRYELDSIIGRARTLHYLCVQIDDPVLANFHAREEPAFGDAVMAGRAWRKHRACEQ